MRIQNEIRISVQSFSEYLEEFKDFSFQETYEDKLLSDAYLMIEWLHNEFSNNYGKLMCKSSSSRK